MAITLPIENQTWARFRILTRKRWGGSPQTPAKSGVNWTIHSSEKTGATSGIRVLDYDRVCLPFVGRARFMLDYGRIDQRIIAPSSTTTSRNVRGIGWAAESDALDIPDLSGHEVRIQASPDGDGEWRTVWWGTIESIEDSGWPAATVPSGTRVYHCVDGLARLARWPLDRHGVAARASGVVAGVGGLRGHPGYNVSRDRDSRLTGNRFRSDDDTNAPDLWITDAADKTSPAPVTARYHAMPGSGDATTWTDQQAIEHALATTRRPQEPLFLLDGNLDRLEGATAWAIKPGENAQDFLVRVLRRERGIGLAFLDWADDSNNPTGPLTVKLTILPQQHTAGSSDRFTYIDPYGIEIELDGSYQAGSNFSTLDLTGDHRNVDSAFRLGAKDQFRLDALETVGEPIEVLVTLAYQDGLTGSVPNQDGASLVRGWSSGTSQSDQILFRAITDPKKRIDERWRPVYQLHRLPPSWGFTVGDGDGGKLSRCDYRCAGEDIEDEVSSLHNGALIGKAQFEQGGLVLEGTSRMLVEIMGDLPLYEGFNYASGMARWDTSQAETANPIRRQVLGLLRVSANKFLKWEETATNLNCIIDGTDLLIYNQANSGDGKRVVSDTTLSHLGAVPTIGNYTALAVTVGLRLPHRVRLYSGLPPTDADCKRKATVTVADHHLWLAHPGAIWDVDGSTGSDVLGHTPRREAGAAASGATGILRDDRAALARRHHMTWSWYSAPRRTVTWALRCCGFLGSFEAFQGSTIGSGSGSSYTYATLGKMIDTITANGERHVVNTPVTRIAYDNTSGTTTWSTDWNELDME